VDCRSFGECPSLSSVCQGVAVLLVRMRRFWWFVTSRIVSVWCDLAWRPFVSLLPLAFRECVAFGDLSPVKLSLFGLP
jgi:hypothetical protein